jgi:hypothetical protein
MRWMPGQDKVFAYGVSWGYLVLRSETDVRLSRFSIELAARDLSAGVAAEVMRNVIVFPLGRGPGRPGGEPELNALMESAKAFAERYEDGGDFEGYPAWQQPLVTRTGRVLTGADVQALADEAERGYDIAELTREQGRAMLGERTTRLVGMSLEEFEAAHDAGTLDQSAPHVAYLVMLLPFARDVTGDANDCPNC